MNREKYIDGLKGMACLAIMFGHLTGVYKYAQDVKNLYSPILETVRYQPLSFVLNENNWVALFCVLSGYLLWLSRIDKITALIRKIINRFVRLLLPIIGTAIFVFLIYKIIGFHNYRTDGLLLNEWFQGYYRKELFWTSIFIEPLRTLIFGAYDINPPYWMIFYLYRASIVIYIAKFCAEYVPKKYRYIIIILCGTIAYFLSGTIGISCFVGVFYNEYKDIIEKHTNNIILYIVILVSVILTEVSSVSFIRCLFLSCFWTSVINVISRNKFPKEFFENRCMLALGKISFGIYSLHFPIMCSLGAFLIIHCSEQIGFIPILFICSFISILFAVFYRYTIEIPSELVQKKLGKLVEDAITRG